MGTIMLLIFMLCAGAALRHSWHYGWPARSFLIGVLCLQLYTIYTINERTIERFVRNPEYCSRHWC